MRKKLLPLILTVILIISGIPAYGQDVQLPEPTREFYVNDFAGVISGDTEKNMVQVNLNYEKTKEKPQIVVATVQNLQGLDENMPWSCLKNGKLVMNSMTMEFWYCFQWKKDE